ncbi:MAG: aminoacyl-tRNA hydrolase [Dehalococcoidia bacterium]|nr:aminoacyl-tRNA hydrolase [Dehalococcoidia bacterium]MDD5494976.1 aminoacyl-tRNA hydrolase [Dehalococcoidia bacterium]
MKIIVGLGNPGKHYKGNRHNVGFHCIDYLADKYSIPLKKRTCQSDIGQGIIADCQVILAKPRTFVNLSGNAVSCLLDKYKANAADLIVIHDDLDLGTGRMRLKLGGRSGGHRGVNSIISCLGTQDFHRVRVGISRPASETGRSRDEDEIVDYVLSDFTVEEEEIINSAISASAEAIKCLISEGIETAMNRYNKRNPIL